MKKSFLSLLVLFLCFHLVPAQIAITEFLANPHGTDADNEWIELYNYSPDAVNLKDWHLKDDDGGSTLISSTNLFIRSGRHLILARDKAIFESLWLGGVANLEVITASFSLTNTDDELILTNATDDEVWRLAYGAGASEGRATFFENEYSFCDPVTDWGSKGGTLINRSGNDPASGTLGYEKNNSTTDSEAYTATNSDVGSPLKRVYEGLIHCGDIQQAGNGAWERIPCRCVTIDQLVIENDYTTPDLSSLWRLEEVESIESINNRGLITTDGANMLRKADFLTFDNDRNLEEVKGFNSLVWVGNIWLRELGKLKRTNGFPVLKHMNSLLIWDAENFEALGLGGFPVVDSFGIYFQNVKRLRDLGGFPALTYLRGLNLRDCDSLLSFSAFRNVHQVLGDLNIQKNNRLKNLNDLANIDTVLGHIWVRNNDSLEDISGLAQMDTVGRRLTVILNPRLDDCCVLSHLLPDKVGDIIDIKDNAPGCNSPIEITGPLSFTCPPNPVKFDLDPGQCAFYTVPDDTLDPFSASFIHATNDFNGISTLQGEAFPKGNTRVTWMVSDNCGHTGTCSYRVKVLDREAPTFLNCPPHVSYVLPFGATGQVHSWPTLEAADNCTKKNKLTLDVFPISGSTFPLGTTTVNATATDKKGNVGTCTFDVTVTENCYPLPAGLSSADIGNTGGVVGKNCYDPTHGGYEILTSGNGIGSNTDGFHFISMSSTNAVSDIRARIVVNANNPKAHVGVMIRQNSAANAASVSTLLKGNQSTQMVNRPAAGVFALSTAGPSLSGPEYWVRLEKVGAVYYSSISTDGSTWTLIQQQVAGITGSYLVGLAATINSPGQVVQFEVDNVSINGTSYRLGATEREQLVVTSFPNPFRDQLNYRLEGVEEEAQVRLLDMTGRVVETLDSNVSTIAPSDGMIRTSEIAAGIYFLEVRTATERKLMKVVKQ